MDPSCSPSGSATGHSTPAKSGKSTRFFFYPSIARLTFSLSLSLSPVPFRRHRPRSAGRPSSRTTLARFVWQTVNTRFAPLRRRNYLTTSTRARGPARARASAAAVVASPRPVGFDPCARDVRGARMCARGWETRRRRDCGAIGCPVPTVVDANGVSFEIILF